MTKKKSNRKTTLVKDVTLGQVWAARGIIRYLLNLNTDSRGGPLRSKNGEIKTENNTIDIVASWRLSKLVPVLTDLELHHNKLIMKYAGEDEDKILAAGEEIKVPEDKQAAFFEELEPLLSEPVEIELSAVRLEHLAGSGLNGHELRALRWMIVEGN